MDKIMLKAVELQSLTNETTLATKSEDSSDPKKFKETPESREQFIANSVERGLTPVWGNEKLLLIDLDSPEELYDCLDKLMDLKDERIIEANISITPGVTGRGYHIYARTIQQLPVEKRVEYQALVGSDHVKEKMTECRITAFKGLDPKLYEPLLFEASTIRREVSIRAELDRLNGI